MSEEVAFLEALKANPADDTARLVYADWLDEHDEAAKAEYLRLVATLTHTCRDCTREQPELSRLLALAESLPSDWRLKAGSRFMLVFYAVRNPARKINVVRSIRQVNGSSVVQANKMFDEAPSRVLECVPFEQALAAQEAMVDEPNGVVVHIHPLELTELPLSVVYSVVVYRTVAESRPDREAATALAIAGFAKFLQAALATSLPTAERLAADQDRVTISENEDLASAVARVARLQRFRPLFDDIAGWAIYIESHAKAIDRPNPTLQGVQTPGS